MEQLIEDLKLQIIESLKLSDIEPSEIDENEPLIGEGLGLDSIDTLELIVLMEKKYGVAVPDIKVGKDVFASVKSMAQYIDKNRDK